MGAVSSKTGFIKDGSIKRDQLSPELRGVRSSGISAFVSTSAPPPATSSGRTVLHRYSQASTQTLTIAAGVMDSLTLNASNAEVSSADVSTGPYSWTVDSDREVYVRVRVDATLDADVVAPLVALRLNDHDVEWARLSRGDGDFEFIAHLLVREDDVMTVEYRAFNEGTASADADITSVVIEVSA